MRRFLITVNGKQYEVDCEEIKENAVSASTAPVASPQVSSPQTAVPPVANPQSAGTIKVNSPMPGTIVKVEVQAGDSVKAGQSLVVLEAMKMENEIKAPEDGIVASVNVSKGASVNTGDLLVSLN